MKNPSLLHYITYYWHQNCAIQLFSIITLMNSGHTCLFHKGFCTVLFIDNEQNAVTLMQSTQRKYEFLVKTKKKPKSQDQITKNKVSLELLHQRLGHRSTRSLLAGYAANIWHDIKIRIDPDPFYKSCQISTINKMIDQRHL